MKRKIIFCLLFLNLLMASNAYAILGVPFEKFKPLYEQYFSKAYQYQKDLQFKKAVSYYKKAISAKKDYDIAYNKLGYCLIKLGKYEKAISNFKNAVKLNPNLADAHFNMGKSYLKINNLNKAKFEYEKLQSMNAEKGASNLLKAINRYKKQLQ